MADEAYERGREIRELMLDAMPYRELGVA